MQKICGKAGFSAAFTQSCILFSQGLYLGSKVFTINLKPALSTTLYGRRSLAMNIPMDFVHSKALGLFELSLVFKRSCNLSCPYGAMPIDLVDRFG